MKLLTKRLSAIVLALAVVLSLGVCSVFAASVAVTKVEILNDVDDVAATYTDDLSNIELSPAQMMKVTVSLTGGDEDSNVTFLSAKSAAEGYDDETIEYIDQVPVEDGVAEILFRPRFGENTFVAKVGGTDAEVVTFNYTVEEPEVPKTITLQASDATAVEDTEGDTVTITIATTGEITGDYTVKLAGETLTAEEDYTIEDTTLTISNSALGAAGTKIVTVSADDVEGTCAITVNAKPVIDEPEIDDEDTQDVVQDNMDAAIPSNPVVSEGSAVVELPAEVDGVGENKHEVIYNIPAQEVGSSIAVSGNTITYTPKQDEFANKITITATTAAGTIEKTMYFINPDIGVAFGNVTVLADENGADIFADDALFETARTTTHVAEISTARVAALNVALAREGAADKVADVSQTLDLDGENGFVLAEYRIYKRMLAGHADYKPSAIKAAFDR